MTFFEKLELWKKENIFLQHVFLNFNEYSNLNFNFPIGFILILFALLFPIAVFLINHRKNTLALCMNQLLRHEAVGEENAKSLSALRLAKSKSLKKMLLSSGRLSSMVKISGYKKPSYDEYIKAKKEKKSILKPDIESAKIYLTKESFEDAEDIASVGVASIWKPIIISISGVAIITLLFIFMPNLLNLLNSALK